MGTWFDGLAKRSARAEQPDEAGLTRRQVLARGALVTGAAWTAPMLLSATPAWAVTSCPQAGDVPAACPGNAESICCPTGQTCIRNTGPGREYVCNIPLGADCGNNGYGTNCNEGRSTCNQACNTGRRPICGGAGATCDDDTDCFQSNCGTSGYCGGVGAVCDSTLQPGDPALTNASNVCSPGACDSNNVATTCNSTTNRCVAA